MKRYRSYRFLPLLLAGALLLGVAAQPMQAVCAMAHAAPAAADAVTQAGEETMPCHTPAETAPADVAGSVGEQDIPPCCRTAVHPGTEEEGIVDSCCAVSSSQDDPATLLAETLSRSVLPLFNALLSKVAGPAVRSDVGPSLYTALSPPRPAVDRQALLATFLI